MLWLQNEEEKQYNVFRTCVQTLPHLSLRLYLIDAHKEIVNARVERFEGLKLY